MVFSPAWKAHSCIVAIRAFATYPLHASAAQMNSTRKSGLAALRQTSVSSRSMGSSATVISDPARRDA
jgi:hypothetical protein